MHVEEDLDQVMNLLSKYMFESPAIDRRFWLRFEQYKDGYISSTIPGEKIFVDDPAVIAHQILDEEYTVQYYKTKNGEYIINVIAEK